MVVVIDVVVVDVDDEDEEDDEDNDQAGSRGDPIEENQEGAKDRS